MFLPELLYAQQQAKKKVLVMPAPKEEEKEEKKEVAVEKVLQNTEMRQIAHPGRRKVAMTKNKKKT